MANDARTILKQLDTVSEWSADLVGYEPVTSSFNPEDEGEARQFLAAWEDARRAGAVVRAVRGGDGGIVLWQRLFAFWLPD